MQILALDLATTTGYAIRRHDGEIDSGRIRLPEKVERDGQRLHALRKILTELKFSYQGFDFVVWENAPFQKGVANERYHNLAGTLMVWCEQHEVGYGKVDVSTIKKFATGKGNAQKPDMIKAAKDVGYNVIDDNEADALHLLRLTMHENNIVEKVRL